MQKAHNNVDWKNWPDISTPLSQSNLNAMDQSIDVIDDRVIVLDTTKANQSDLLTAVARLEFDDESGILTIYYKNGLTDTIDTGLSKLTTNWDYDDDPTSEHYQDLVLEMADGTYKYVDLSALINNHEFADTDTINITITNGVVSADVIDGSITDQKLETNYLANITTQANHAAQAASAAAISESNASDSADDAEDSALISEGWAVGKQNGIDVEVGSDYFENNSKYYKEQAEASATSAAGSATSASLSAGSAQNAFVGASEIQTDVTNMRNAVRTWHQDVQQNATSVASNTATAQTASNTAVNASNAAVAANSSAQSAATRAEAAADRAEEIVDLDVMTPTRNGIGKPDGVTITVDENGTFSTTASLHMQFVDELPPIATAHENVIYLVPTSAMTGDIYEEWVVGYDEEEEERVWVQIGDTSVDLTNYTTKTYVDGHINTRISTESGVHGIRFYNNKLQRSTGTTWIDIETGGGGHTIVDKDNTDMTQRGKLQFGGYLTTTDSALYDRSIVSDAPTPVAWTAWQNMTTAQKQGTKWLITDVPSGGGGGSTVTITPTITTGTKIADYTIDGVGGALYSPNSGGGGGHTIVDNAGTSLTQRGKLKTVGGLNATDDGVNNTTEITDVVEEVPWATWQSYPSEEAALQAHPNCVVTGAPDCDGDIEIEFEKVLWTNENPTSAFGAGQITLNSSDYTDYEVRFAQNKNSTSSRISSRTEKGKGTLLNYSAATGSGVRTFSRGVAYVDATHLSIADCTYATGTTADVTNNDNCIPIEVIGHKRKLTAKIQAIARNVSTSASNCMMSDEETSVEDASVKSYPFSGTTNANGNIQTSYSGNYAVVGLKINTPSDYYGIPYYSTSSSIWFVRVKKWDDTTLLNTQVTGTIYVRNV